MQLALTGLSASLARSVLVLGDAPPLLPDAGPFQKWVLEQPLAPSLLLLAVGAALFYILRGQGKAREGRTFGLVLALLGVAIYVTGTLVETANEKLVARAREFVNAVATVNSTQVDGFLAPDASVAPFGFDRDTIMRRLEADLGHAYRIKSHSIQSVRAVVDGPSLARTQVRVTAVVDSALYAAPVGSWWMITWRQDTPGGVWKVREIELQALDRYDDVKNLRP
jgi:uncharacterized protein YjhX (UPF0386 family)